MRVLLSAITIIASAIPAFADEVTGTVLAFDRVDNVIVLDDKTVWTVPAGFPCPLISLPVTRSPSSFREQPKTA